MESSPTLLLNRNDVVANLSIDECIPAVETAFRLYADGKTITPKVLGLHVAEGGFHIKAGILNLSRDYFVAKVNANFPGNPRKFNLPTIQGAIIVMDSNNGNLLAVIDSIEITIIRTGAATGVAAKYLSLPDATTATICGCGNQGRISMKAVLAIRSIKKVYAYDIDESQTQRFKNEFSDRLEVISTATNNLPNALNESEIIITCTP